MKILLVDDNSSITELLSQYLEVKGYQCTSRQDGRSGLDLIRSGKFDLIFLDLAMPEFSGMDLLKELSSNELKENNIALLTASNISDSQMKEINKVGVKSIIKKPVKLQTLVDFIESTKPKQMTSKI